MPNNSSALLMWENNPDTPINANNLSETIDFQSQGKFIHFTNTLDDYEAWAEATYSQAWPTDIDNWSQQDSYFNKITYNTVDNTVRRLIYDPNQERRIFESLPTPYKKILRIKAKTKISAYYVDSESQPQTINFDFGEEDQIFTIDDLLTQDTKDYTANTKYFIYLYVLNSYQDHAHIKVLKADDENLSFWKTTSPSSTSPTGYDLISYRKIGGFKTNSGAEIDEESIWDLYTYQEELVAEKIKVFENGEVRPISAADFTVIDNQDLFSSSGSELTVEEALFQTRALVNNLNDKFYTNRRFGMNIQFSPVVPDGTSYTQAPLNAVTLRITPGFIDVLGAQVTKEEMLYLADPSVGFRINDGSNMVYNAQLISEDDGGGTSIYPGVWRIYIDYNGTLILRHELAENGSPRWISHYFGWFDTTGKRCIGKFRVRSNNGNYIERYSVADTFDINAGTNSIHVHYGTLCPDGLLPCDGKWRDIYGIDTDAYDFEELPPPSQWGDSWYEETPDYMHRTIRGADPAFSMITGGPYNPLTNAGGADDYTMLGGSGVHKHSFPHGHGPGTLNVLPSGIHPGDHQVDFNGSTEYIEVDTTVTGQKVSVYDHEHNMTITGGLHTHANTDFAGKSETLSGSAAETQDTSSWPPYREALICIKKV